MGLLDRVDPAQRQLLMIGAPVVAVFAFVASRKSATTAATDAATAAAAGTSGWTMPSTDAIGTGQLADYESLVTGRLNDLSTQVGTQTALIANPPAPQVAPPAPAPEMTPAPPPIVAAPPVCSPPAGWPGLAGEVIITRLLAPGGGCWYITNYGGVANVAGAPQRGSCLANNNQCRMGPGYENPPRYVVSAVNNGSGYTMYSNKGETYNF
jgi:hypothetical protein